MNSKERINLIRILDRSINAIKKEDIISLKDLSNQSIHDAAIIQDEHTITIAVLVYTLSKFYERKFHYGTFKGWHGFCNDCLEGLEKAREKLQKNDIEGFENELKSYMKNLSNSDGKLNNYIKDVLNRARVNKASRLYEHGLSIGRTADILGINNYELMDYIGKTYIADVKENKTLSVKKRMEVVRNIFSWKI